MDIIHVTYMYVTIITKDKKNCKFEPGGTWDALKGGEEECTGGTGGKKGKEGNDITITY